MWSPQKFFIDDIYAFEMTDRLLSLVLFIRVLDVS